jgi:uncharacterized LabA/DUF88 family protein
VSTAHPRVVAYVDGFNLYHGMHDARARRGLWLDLERMLATLISTDQQLVRVHYFTALVQGPGQARQRVYLDALAAHSRLTIAHVGRFQQKAQNCRGCGATWHTYEEKESDVSFGVQLVEDAAQRLFDQALIVSGDSDMVPAIRAVRRLAPSARLLAVFPPRRSSQSLSAAVDATLKIYDRLPERHQLPDPVTTLDGSTTYPRPAHWR